MIQAGRRRWRVGIGGGCAAVLVVVMCGLAAFAELPTGVGEDQTGGAASSVAAGMDASPASTVDPTASLSASARNAGQALREALDAIKTQEAQAAQERLLLLFRDQADLRDLIAWAEAQAWYERGEVERALGAVLRGFEAKPSEPIAARLEELRGTLAADAGDEAAARSAWQRGLALTRERELRTRLGMALAASWERSERVERAAERYREVWSRDPDSDAALEADARLTALEAAGAIAPRGPQDYIARGDRLFQRRHSEAALAAYEHALTGALPGAERQRIADRRAHCLFRLRRYPEATAAFANLPGLEAKLWKGRSLARSDLVEDAIDLLTEVAREATGSLAVRARYLTGLLHEGRGREALARAAFEAVVASEPGGGLASDARWRLAWGDYLEGRSAQARVGFEALRRATSDPIDQLRPRYWAARSVQESNPERGQAELAALAREFPLTYYGWQAAAAVEGGEAVEEVRNAVAASPARLDAQTVFRIETMIAAGLDETARVHLDGLRKGARNLREHVRVAELYAEAGDYYQSLRTVVDPYGVTLARGVSPDLGALWEVAWPRAWQPLVLEASPAELDPEVVWSVMREESAYRPDVVSVTGALGLLQIMPETGERLARDAGFTEFSPRLLLAPDVNVRLGALYLRQLSLRFEGRLPAAIASYNAGPHAVRRWVREGHPADDVWIESIPYSQTRAYVKRVLRSVAAYRAVYRQAL